MNMDPTKTAPANTNATTSDAAPVATPKQRRRKFAVNKKLAAVAVVAVACAAGYVLWTKEHNKPPQMFASSNGRIEATQVDVATKYPGRLIDLTVYEGDYVHAGQRVGVMDVQTLQAQRDEAAANRQGALEKVAEAQAQVALRESEVQAKQAQVAARESDRQAQEALLRQRDAELDAAQRHFARSEILSKEGASAEQELDDDRARTRGAEASVASATATLAANREAVAAARAEVTAAQAAGIAARKQVTAAQAQVQAYAATIRRIDADLADRVLVAPREARVQYRVAEPGEVLNAGGRVLNLVDLSDVYMTFFLPETLAGKVALGAEARIVLDSAPKMVIPAYISYVASVAQFTPKSVETAIERQKLTFRLKAQIDPELLKRNSAEVKTGLPGVAWVRLDPKAQWPPELTVPPELRVPPGERVPPEESTKGRR
jgi:HlyD family secretion protein